MKRKWMALLMALATISMSAYSLGGGGLFDSDNQIANARKEKVLEALQSKDESALKALFSKSAIADAKNFDDGMKSLFDYYEGDFVSYNNWGGPGVEETREDGYRLKEFYSTYDVKTSERTYRFAMQDVTIDIANPNNVGIRSLYVIKMEDDTDPLFAYRGDGQYTPGINMNIKNYIPPDDES